MMQYKTPGVYIVEKDAFPNSVVEVPTAIPAFLGYTQTAADGPVSKKWVPTYIESMADYVKFFGGPYTPAFSLTQSADKKSYAVAQDPTTRFFLYHSVALYFANGGGPAYVVSVGSYDDAVANGKLMTDFLPQPDPKNPTLQAPFDALKKVLDVTLIVAPDTTLLNSVDDWNGVWGQALMHCGYMQSRMSLIDIYGGDAPRTHDPDSDIISGNNGFREKIGTNFLNYGATYYPWVNFNVVDENSITYYNLDDTSLATLTAALNAELDAMNPQPSATMASKMRALYSTNLQRQVVDSQGNPLSGDAAAAAIGRYHNQLLQVSPLYKRIVSDMLRHVNLLPPCAAMAGVYALVDANEGVAQAPANRSIALAVSPAVDLSAEDQEDLNMPLDGKAVNAIRNIPGRGLVIWGGRTLDGNSQDWRYINVRRTLIMLEQSIKMAVMTYVFAPNDAATWVAVQNMISNFLVNQWKDGALAGAKPQDAFSVAVGLGTTMTGDDILDGYMRVTIKVAITHPAEFIELTFQQQMQVS
jgi:phage tail sheath protein FI